MKNKLSFFLPKKDMAVKELNDSNNEKKDVLDLGRDVMIEIFKKMNRQDLNKMCLVSRRWHYYASSNLVWKEVLLKENLARYSFEYINKILSGGKNIRNEIIKIGIQNKINKIDISLKELSQDNYRTDSQSAGDGHAYGPLGLLCKGPADLCVNFISIFLLVLDTIKYNKIESQKQVLLHELERYSQSDPKNNL